MKKGIPHRGTFRFEKMSGSFKKSETLRFADYTCYPKLSGKTLGEIADMIENSSDKRTDIWTQELIEQAVAYLIKINS